MLRKLHLLLLLFPVFVTYSQVSIGHNNPDASAVLDVSQVSADGIVQSKGFLVPRMTTAERDAIESPATGLIIYNTETKCNECYQGIGKGWYNFCATIGDDGSSSNGTAIVSGYDCQNGKEAARTGRLVAETPLLDNVTHKIIATVVKGGEYNLSAAVNGIVFAAKGTFAEPDPANPATSVQEITLKGTGTPLAIGNYAFNLNSVPDCYFNREVFEATSGGSSIVSFWGCEGADAGTLTAGRTIASETPPVAVTKTIKPWVDKIGTYYIEFPSSNGIVFKAEGTFTALSSADNENLVTLTASGIPLEIDAATKFDLPLKPTCSFTREVKINPTSNGTSEVSAYVATTTTKGKLQYQKDIVAGEVTHTVTATVVNPGKYNIATDTQNGATFKLEGAFAAAGEQPVELVASGKPDVIGDFDYTTNTTPPNVVFTRATVGNESSGGSSEISSFFCDTSGAGPGEGVMMKDVEIMDGEVTQIVKVNVTTLGTYDITTDTVNGVYFYAKGSFAAVGTLQTIIFKAKGTPTAASTAATGVTFTIGTTPNCAFNRVILDKNSSGGTSTVTAYDCNGANGNTGNIIVNKQIEKATTDITKTIKVTVGSVGTYYIRAAKNGVVFSALGTFTAADITNSPINVVLKAQGKANIIAAAATFSLDVVGPDPSVTLSCNFDREFFLNPSSNGTADVATYECKGEGTGGTGITTVGTAIIDETDTTSDRYVSQTVIADVRELGTYNITIRNNKLPAPNEVESNIVFEASGTFTTTGKQPLVLKAKPNTSGQTPFYDSSKDVDSDLPAFTIKPVSTSGPEYTYCTFKQLILNSATGGTSRVGQFQCGTALNKTGVLINGAIIPVAPAAGDVTHTVVAKVDQPGSYNLKSIKNGVTFRASGLFTATGDKEVVFIATGIPIVTPAATVATEFLTNVEFKIWPFLPVSAGCPACSPPKPPQPIESDPIETGPDLGCVFNRNIAEPVFITKQPDATKICEGANGPATMTVEATGGVDLKFQWQKDGVDVVLSPRIEVSSDKFKSTLTFKNSIAADEGNYTCVVSNGSTATTIPAKFTVNPLPTVSFLPNLIIKKCIASGSSTTFSLAAKVDFPVAGNDYKINWYSATGDLLVTKQSGDTYTTVEIAANAGSVAFIVGGLNSTTGCETLTSARKNITVSASAAPALPTNTNQQYCGTTTVTLTPLVTGANVVGRWYDQATDTAPRANGTFTVTAASPAVPLTVYLSAYNSVALCESAKIPIVLTAHSAPTGVTINSPTTLNSCGPDTVALNASAVGGGANTQVRWYLGTNASPEAGGVVNSGINFSTGLLAENPASVTGSKIYVYKVDAYDPDAKCAFTGTKPSVTITINKLPNIISAPTAKFCVQTAGTVTATAGNEGNQVRWYETSVSTPALFISASGAPLDISSLNLTVGSHTLYVTGFNSDPANLCESTTRTPLIVEVNDSPAPPTPTLTMFARCAHSTGSGAINLTVISGGITKQASWYDVDSGGTALATNTNVFSPMISATKAFYVEFKDSTTGCISSTVHGRTLINAVWSAAPAAPTVTNGFRCGAGSITLTASTTTAGATINWHDAPIGGTLLKQDSGSYDTGDISVEKKFYVEAWLKETGGVLEGCPSFTRTEAVATINAEPAVPVADIQTPPYVCGTGTAKLSVRAVTGIDMYWYDAAGTPLTTTPSNEYTITAPISAETTYFVEAKSASCSSTSRGEIKAKHAAKPDINAFPQNPVVCYSRPFTQDFIVTNGNVVKYRTVGATTGGTENPLSWTVDSVIATHDWDWVGYNTTTQCESAPRRLTLTTKAAGDLPTTPVTGIFCGGTIKNAPSASIAATSTMDWYDTELVGTGNLLTSNSSSYTPPTAPAIGATATYYVEGKNTITGCPSETRLAVLVKSYNMPTINVTTSWTGCAGDYVSIPVRSTNATDIGYAGAPNEALTMIGGPAINWYFYYASGVLYWAARNEGCQSDYKQVNTTALARPATPTAPIEGKYCGTEATIVPSASIAAGSRIDWYNTSAIGTGTLLQSNSNEYTPTSPPPLGTNTYYAEGRHNLNSCPSATRLAVTVKSYNMPIINVTTSWTGCAGEYVSIPVRSTNATNIGYAGATNEALTMTGYPAFNWYFYYASGVLYWAARNEGCQSEYKKVTTTALARPAMPTAPIEGKYCGTDAVIVPSASIAAGSYIDWYDTSALGTGTLLQSNSSSYTPSSQPPVGTNTYYAEGRHSLNTCPSSSRLAVTVKSYNKPTINVTPSWTGCAGDFVSIPVRSTNATNIGSAGAPNEALSLIGGPAINWYFYYSTGVLYWGAINEGCASPYTQVNTTALPRPTLAPTNPVITPAAGSTFVLTATPPSGHSLAWFDNATAGTKLADGNSYTTPALTAATPYYAASVGTNGCPATTNRLVITPTP